MLARSPEGATLSAGSSLNAPQKSVAVPPATGAEVGVSLGEVVSEADCDAVSEGDDATAVSVGDTLDATVLGVDEQPASTTRNRSESGATRRFMPSLLRGRRKSLGWGADLRGRRVWAWAGFLSQTRSAGPRPCTPTGEPRPRPEPSPPSDDPPTRSPSPGGRGSG